ncbi:hypothetical protein BJ170DRAFT_624944 [Xylariales sp. AK1849]|nr:hypothetical protein BJ170DRAFT_624944 [Xylariales sp. AK1849]
MVWVIWLLGGVAEMASFIEYNTWYYCYIIHSNLVLCESIVVIRARRKGSARDQPSESKLPLNDTDHLQLAVL